MLGRQRALFFLGKAFYHERRHDDAVTVFASITRQGQSHIFYYQTLQWVAQLATQLPREPRLVEALGRYELSDIRTFDRPEGRELYAHLLVVFGRARFAAHRYAEARVAFELVREGAEAYPLAREWLQRTYATIGPM